MTKTTVATIAVILMATPTLAADCGGVGQIAEKIMMARQQEKPMSAQVQFFNELADISEASRGALLTYVVRAYEQPSYQTPENQQRAAAEFRNEIELECYRFQAEAAR